MENFHISKTFLVVERRRENILKRPVSTAWNAHRNQIREDEREEALQFTLKGEKKSFLVKENYRELSKKNGSNSRLKSLSLRENAGRAEGMALDLYKL